MNAEKNFVVFIFNLYGKAEQVQCSLPLDGGGIQGIPKKLAAFRKAV